MHGSRRTEDEIRREITTERAQLQAALADLRRALDAKRRPAAVAAMVIAAGLAAAASVKVSRLFRR